jgi:hypothetical protein
LTLLASVPVSDQQAPFLSTEEYSDPIGLELLQKAW